MIPIHAVVFLLFVAAPAPEQWAREAAAAEEAGRYPLALTLYTRIVSEAPGSYGARTAATRKADLAAHADHDFVPYARYRAILKNYVATGSDRSVAEAQAILDAYPGSKTAPDVLFWLANEYREARGRPGEAEALYLKLAKEYPESPDAPVALDRVGRLREARGDYPGAEQVYAGMQARFPGAASAKAFQARRNEVVRGHLRQRFARIAWGVLGFAVLIFLGVGGWRFHPKRWISLAGPRIGFALVLGLSPSAFLWWYDGLWSPSLTTLSAVFSLYGAGLAMLAARKRVPPGRFIFWLERLTFNLAAPLASLYLVIHAFGLWEAFGL